MFKFPICNYIGDDRIGCDYKSPKGKCTYKGNCNYQQPALLNLKERKMKIKIFREKGGHSFILSSKINEWIKIKEEEAKDFRIISINQSEVSIPKQNGSYSILTISILWEERK